jgi:5-methyltetrahydropteroyltriglutamate--homocysteine methyltransferase
MKKSDSRILTTHVGSLPRNPALTDLLIKQEHGQPIDQAALDHQFEQSVKHVIKNQLEAGIDIGNDGEQPRVGFQTYVPQRVRGYGGATKRKTPRDLADFPDFAKIMEARQMMRAKVFNAPQCVAELQYEDLTAARKESDLFLRCAKESPRQFTELFMTAAAPGIIATTMHNAFYDSHERYVFAIAEQMRKEYEHIHSQGLILQLDAPDLAMERPWHFQEMSTPQFQKVVETHIEAINRGIKNIPADRVRLHVCWGNYDGPHNHDVPLADIIQILYQAKVGALSIEFANPRHQHEHKVFKKFPLPDSKILIPGVIDSTTNYIEHPEVVADRICQAAEAVGDRSRVIAGADCGFGTFAGWEMVPESVVWAKFKTLSEGASLATRRLWG